jgi:hypothetical protein
MDSVLIVLVNVASFAAGVGIAMWFSRDRRR